MASRLSAGEMKVRFLRKPLQREKEKKKKSVSTFCQICISLKILKIRFVNNRDKKYMDHKSKLFSRE